MNIYLWLGFIVLSFSIGFIMGEKTGLKVGYDSNNNNNKNKDIINKLCLKYPNRFS